MADQEIDILKKALARERNARKQAEKILEEKSRELYLLSQKLKHNLNETTTELNGVFDNLVDAYVLMDVQGNVVKMNDAAKALFGYDHTIEKLNVVQLIYKEDMHYAMQSFAKLLKEAAFSDYQARVNTKNNGVRNVHINASLIKNETGAPIAAQGIVRDITKELKNQEERKHLIQDLEHKNQDLNDFAHIVSHDLKSPLRSIYTLVNWLREDHKDVLVDSGLKNIKLIEQTLEKMEQLINGILTYSSASNREALKTERVDLNQTIEDIQKTIFIPPHIKVYCKNKLPVITGDRTKIQQLFQNLISNAVNYIDKKEGLVTIDFKDTKSHHVFSIEDNGIGIKKEYHEKIFKIFQSLNDHKDSTGIGLSIVSKIVDLYEGEIWLDSTPNKGTTFFFSLKKEAL